MLEQKKLVFIIINFISLVIIATVGYSFILDISVLDALYMTMITISTVGFGEIVPLTIEGKLFTIAIIVWGLGVVGYTFSNLIVAFVDGKLRAMWRHKMLDSRIAKLKNHYIVCGSGNTGHVVIEEFLKNNLDFVVIEENEQIYFEMVEKGILCIHGDATEDSILMNANIERAVGLISALSDDIDNVMTVLTARQLNSELYIISRAKDDHSPKKLKKAGANRVISTNQISGKRMAALMLRPNVITFLDLINSVGGLELEVQDIIVNKESYLENMSLAKAEIPKKTGLTILAIQREDSSSLSFNLNPEDIFHVGDTLIVLGTDEQVYKLRSLAGDNGLRIPKFK